MRKLYILISMMMALFASPAFAGVTADTAPSPFNDANHTEKIVISRIMPDGSVKSDTLINARLNYEGERITVITGEGGSFIPSLPTTPPKKMSNVMFGLELSTSLDLSGSDLSTFNLDALIGYRHKVIQLLGISLGIHKSLGTRDSFIPIQAVFRTGFSSRPTIPFFHLSAGYSFNTISSSPMLGDFCATIGAGANLVRNPRFQSNIILAFGFRHFTERHREIISINKSDLGFAQISFGISF